MATMISGWVRAVTSKAGQFMVQGALLAMCAAFGSTMAASLFLANAGSAALPVYYMFFAALSIPLSAVFSGVIDRWPRRTIMTGLLVVYMTGAAIMSLFIGKGVAGYYAIYLVISICELMIYSIYYIMFSDYFTVTEGKRYGGTMTVALGVGAMIGALLVSLLTEFIEARHAFLALPVLVGVTLLHLTWLTRRVQPLDETEAAAEEGMIESLKALPKLTRRYPIVLLMAASVFINIFIQCVMEFEAYSIYATSFPDEGELASFIGRMSAIVDLIGIAIVFFVSNPLIPRVGVAKMNLAAPAINFASLLILGASSSLPAGILAHLNYYPLEHSLNVPVFSLTYNAMPHRFVGRIRVINDGIVYPLALAAAGLALLLLEHILSLSQVAFITAVPALLYLLAQRGVGREYARGLLQMLRSGAIDLENIGEGFRLPEAYSKDIREMLKSDDGDIVILGLEIAARCDIVISDADLERILPTMPMKSVRAVLTAIGKRHTRELSSLLLSAAPQIRARAFEALIVQKATIDRATLDRLMHDPDEAVRAIWAASQLAVNSEHSGRAQEMLSCLVAEDAALGASYILAHAEGPVPQAVLEALSRHPSASVRAESLLIAARRGAVGDASLAAWAARSFSDTDGQVRAAASALLAQTASEDEISRIRAEIFADGETQVHEAGALALGRRGPAGLAALADQLGTGDRTMVSVAMDGIGAAGADKADPIIEKFLVEHIFPKVRRNQAIAGRLP
jgi:MFS family permease